jgi:18S rRNA (guanine1575-N7)-methyltransferase
MTWAMDLVFAPACLMELSGKHPCGNQLPSRSKAWTYDNLLCKCSVSAVQWLFYSDRKDHRSSKRLMAFFTSLYRCLRRGARAALQFYPESSDQLELVTAAALRCGFSGGLVVDFPNSTKAKKYYLCLFAGVDPSVVKMPAAKLSEAVAAGVGDAVAPAHEHRRHAKKAARKGARQAVKSRDWVIEQKDSRRRKGLEVRPDTKYTGRNRGIKF